jgi:hypothetical protein
MQIRAIDRLPIVALALAILQSLAVAAHAQRCPSPVLDPVEIEEHIAKAPTCRAAYRVLEACQRGSSGDVRVARQVVAKCEATFLPRLTTAEAGRYSREKAECRGKHAGRQGAEFSSFSTFCEAEAALRYARD